MSRRASLWWWIELPGLREEPDGWRSSRSAGDGCCMRRTPEMEVVVWVVVDPKVGGLLHDVAGC